MYEKCAKLGGMLRYGIPNYRLPREVLDAEIASMLALGIDVHVNVNVGDDVTFDELRQQNDALYIALGAHTDKKTGIEGEDAGASSPRSRCCARSATITCRTSATRTSSSSAAATSRWMSAAARFVSARAK